MRKYYFLLISLLFSIIGMAQINITQPFTIRKSSKAPAPYTNKEIYNLRGDFLLIGNSNARPEGTITGQTTNVSDMRFIDVDTSTATVNSTSATLVKPDDIDLTCTKIIYAGLYWTGRNNEDGDNIRYSSNGAPTSNSPTLNRKSVKFRTPGMSNYKTLTADGIHFGGSSTDRIYTAYADVTDDVISGKFGEYWVADIASRTGTDAEIGFFAGWGMVVIYENPQKKWRDITVFDGFAYVNDNTNRYGGHFNDGWTDGFVDLNGFNAAQSGPIHVSMGMMAAEGDRNISDDRFQIRKSGTDTYVPLMHSGTTSTTNFFNSSVIIDGNTRNPNYTNNFGIDIIKIELPNVKPGPTPDSYTNDIIKNKDTSTQFSYGSDQDLYSIFNIVFAVDAYVPDAEGVNLPQKIYIPADSGTTAQTITNPSAVAARMANLQPGDEVTMRMSLYNYGNENIKDAKIDVNIPSAMRLIKAEVVNKSVNTHIVASTNNGNSTVSFNQAFWIDPITPNYNPSTPIPSINSAVANDGGILRWNIGVIPQQILPDTNTTTVAMSYLEYTLKVTSDCAKLRTSNNECILNPQISGNIEGKGVNSGANLDPRLITGYNSSLCGSTPTYEDVQFTINPSNTFLANCSEVFKGDELVLEYFCSVPTGTTIPRATIANYFPLGTKFYATNPTAPSFDSVTMLITGDFNVILEPAYDTATIPNLIGEEERFYAILPGTTNFSCYNNIHILVKSITSKPKISVFESVCSGTNYNLPVSLSDIGTAKNLNLVYFSSLTSSSPLSTPPKPTAVGEHIYWVAEASTDANGEVCYGEKVEFSIYIKGCSMKVNPQIYNTFK